MSIRLSIIIPTSGRRSLGRTLDSIRDQELIDGDEVLVIADGPQPLAREVFERSGLKGQYVETVATRDFGGSQRNRGLDLSVGHYLLFMDDDDVYSVDAFATIRQALAENPERPHIFRMRYATNGRILWKDRSLMLGNLSTQMITFPNRPDLLRWDPYHGHDFRFLIKNLVLWTADSLVWRDEIIAIIRPHEASGAVDSSGDPREGPLPVNECPFRESLPDGRGPNRGFCRLLKQLSMVHNTDMCEVRLDACEACCRSSAPSQVHLNPVLGSLLHTLAEDILARGGVAGCNADEASRLKAFAERSLDVEVAIGAATIEPRNC